MTVAARTSNPSETNGNAQHIPSVHTDQQVDIKAREFQRVSRRNGERWAGRTATKREVIGRLEKINQKDALRMKQCCSIFKERTCGQHTVASYPTFRCKRHYCPDCAAERAARISRQTEARILEAMKTVRGRLCFLTLTNKNAPTLAGGLAKIKKDFKNFKRTKAFKQHIKGYFGGFEYTFNSKTNDFHVHLHLIVMRGEFWNQSDISDAWREATGDSFVVDIRQVRDLHKGVKELCKYIVKPLDLRTMPDDRFREVVEMKKGTRMFISGGCFYNVKLDEADDDEKGILSEFQHLEAGDPCPFCKETLFDVLVDRGQHIELQNLNAMSNLVKNNSS